MCHLFSEATFDQADSSIPIRSATSAINETFHDMPLFMNQNFVESMGLIKSVNASDDERNP